MLGEHDRYYQLVEQAAAAGRRDGLTPLDAAAGVRSRRVRRLVRRRAASCSTSTARTPTPSGRDLDLFAAIADAITYNGGPMTTHVCCAPT